MNERIKTSIAGSTPMMRGAAIATIVAQVLSVVDSVIRNEENFVISFVFVTATASTILAIFLLQASNAQESYAKSDNENELLEGLKKETTYWQVTIILYLIVFVIILLLTLVAWIWADDIIRSLQSQSRF